MKQACKDMLLVTEVKKKESIIREIGRMGESEEDVISQELQSVARSNSQPRTLGPMNKFINLEARQSTLKSSYKEAKRNV